MCVHDTIRNMKLSPLTYWVQVYDLLFLSEEHAGAGLSLCDDDGGSGASSVISSTKLLREDSFLLSCSALPPTFLYHF